MIGRILKRVVRRAIVGIIKYPIRGVIVLVAMLAAAGILLFQGFQTPTFNLSLPSVGLPFRTSSAPAATESYMKGNETFDAQLIWSSLSEEAAARYRSRGHTPETLQKEMEQAKQAGTAFEQITYIGGQSFPDGTSMHFYVVLARGSTSRGEAEYVPYVFSLDRDGKISRVQ